MRTLDIDDAKRLLTQLVCAVEDGIEAEIVISRDGRPSARLVPVRATTPSGKRIGSLAGRYPPMSLEDFDADNEEIGALIRGDDL